MRYILVVYLALASAFTIQAQDIDVLRPSGQWVTDTAEILSVKERNNLAGKLASFAESSSTQIIIVTIPDLGGYEASEYATALGREWGVGQSQFNNGVVILRWFTSAKT